VAVETSRSMSVGARVRPEAMERLRRRALETLKQCGGAWAPEVIGPVPLFEALRLGQAGGRWIASASAQSGPPEGHAGALAILVGPEGGFTADEHEAALAAEWRPVRLARSTLRYETAALAALALAAAARVTAHPGGAHR
jgi:16S rRNA (uracil1498-N3)-methyltransferase